MKQSAQTRVRLARKHGKLTQHDLARLVGVHRSAVSQWEAALGSKPTSDNLARIAISAGVSYEWLATGRGQMAFSSDLAESSGALLNYCAHNEVEARALAAMRRLSMRHMLAVVEMLEALGSQRAVKLTRKIPDHR